MIKIDHNDKFDLEMEHQMPFLIVTPNLLIRPLINEDKKQLFEALRESFKMLRMWLPWAENIPNANDYHAIGEQFYKEGQDGLSMHYVVYRNEQFLGMCSLSNYHKEFESARLGFWCRSSNQNPNLFLEAINAIIQYTFKNTKLQTIYIPSVVGNFISEDYVKELNFKLSSIEIINGAQIKIFRISAKSQLPRLEIHWVRNDEQRVSASP